MGFENAKLKTTRNNDGIGQAVVVTLENGLKTVDGR